MEIEGISEEIRQATNREIAYDENALEINDLELKVSKLETDLRVYEHLLDLARKKRPKISIKWRDSIKWCLTVDSRNPRFFLKSTPGVYKCIAFKHKVEITSDIKNKIAVTLSALYKEKIIGRYEYHETYIYGLKEFFNDDLTDLKEEYKIGLDRLYL